MKKVKLVFWLIILVVIATVIFQNKMFLQGTPKLGVDLWIVEYSTEQVSNAILLSVTFLVGLLVSYFLSISDRLKSRKTIKKLNTEITSHIQELSELNANTHKQNASIDKHTDDT